MYHYIKNNQNNIDKVKHAVISLRKIFKEYKQEIRGYMKIECNKTMIAETRNNVDQLKK